MITAEEFIEIKDCIIPIPGMLIRARHTTDSFYTITDVFTRKNKYALLLFSPSKQKEIQTPYYVGVSMWLYYTLISSPKI